MSVVPATISPLNEKQIPALITLWQRCNLVRPWNDPKGDISLALSTPGCTILIAQTDDSQTVIASAMAGFDGHRGWIYYVAVDPDHQGKGYSRKIMRAAEDTLRDQGCTKVELIIRGENKGVKAVYEKLGYKPEDRLLMTKWLVQPPVQQVEPSGEAVNEDVPIHDVTVTFLEMKSAPTAPPKPQPVSKNPLVLQRVIQPTSSYYRYLHFTVGDPWLWYSRRTWDDDRLASVIHDDRVEIYTLSQGGVPAGFIELDFRSMPDEAEIAYFGLLPDFIGRGLGPYLLDWGIRCAWNREPAPERLIVNTCTLDHPSALNGYQKLGFRPYRRVTEKVPDPVALGIIPAAKSS